MNFSVPEDVKEAFNKAFEGENKSAVITRLMVRAVDEHARTRRSQGFVEKVAPDQVTKPERWGRRDQASA